MKTKQLLIGIGLMLASLLLPETIKAIMFGLWLIASAIILLTLKNIDDVYDISELYGWTIIAAAITLLTLGLTFGFLVIYFTILK